MDNRTSFKLDNGNGSSIGVLHLQDHQVRDHWGMPEFTVMYMAKQASAHADSSCIWFVPGTENN